MKENIKEEDLDPISEILHRCAKIAFNKLKEQHGNITTVVELMEKMTKDIVNLGELTDETCKDILREAEKQGIKMGDVNGRNNMSNTTNGFNRRTKNRN